MKQIARLDRVCFSYSSSIFSRNGSASLKDLSFDIYKGETLGIIGKNGAGKSTLVRLLAGIIRPDSGEYWNQIEHPFLLTLQAGFAGHLTGRENAVLNGMLLGMQYKDIKDRLESIKEYSELGEKFDLPLSTYSTGMRARLGFSIAIQADMEMLIIDETMGVGDKEFRAKSSEDMKEKVRSNSTVVLISHDLKLIQSLCQRCIVIENGMLKKIGPAEDVINEYMQA